MCQRGFDIFFFHSVQHFWPSEDEEKVECCGNVQSLFFQQMLPRRCPQSQHCSGDIAVNDEENEDKHGDDDDFEDCNDPDG